MLIARSTVWAAFISHLRSSTLPRLELVQWLSCALECEREWMSHLGSRMRVRSLGALRSIQISAEETDWWLSNLIYLFPDTCIDRWSKQMQESIAHYLQLTLAQDMAKGNDRGSYYLVQFKSTGDLTMIQTSHDPGAADTYYAAPTCLASVEHDGSPRLWRLRQLNKTPWNKRIELEPVLKSESTEEYSISDKIEFFSQRAITTQRGSFSTSRKIFPLVTSPSLQSKPPSDAGDNMIRIVGLTLESAPESSYDSTEADFAFFKNVQ